MSRIERMIFAVLTIGVLATVHTTSYAQSPKLPEKSKFHLFLLVGQSNMAGRGKVAPVDQVPHPRVLTLNKNNQWVPAVDPIHFDKSVAGVGLGRTFGITVAELDPSITVGLIPCAAGGSPISSWEPGGYHGQTKSHPYDEALTRAKLAMRQGTLKAILWHQGESDGKEGLAEIYEEKLHALIQRFRSELSVPQVPFIVGQMGVFAERPWPEAKKMVNATHESLPSKVEHTAFIPATALTPRSDLVHFDAKSMREFGKRYAAAYLKLCE